VTWRVADIRTCGTYHHLLHSTCHPHGYHAHSSTVCGRTTCHHHLPLPLPPYLSTSTCHGARCYLPGRDCCTWAWARTQEHHGVATVPASSSACSPRHHYWGGPVWYALTWTCKSSHETPCLTPMAEQTLFSCFHGGRRALRQRHAASIRLPYLPHHPALGVGVGSDSILPLSISDQAIHRTLAWEPKTPAVNILGGSRLCGRGGAGASPSCLSHLCLLDTWGGAPATMWKQRTLRAGHFFSTTPSSHTLWTTTLLPLWTWRPPPLLTAGLYAGMAGTQACTGALPITLDWFLVAAADRCRRYWWTGQTTKTWTKALPSYHNLPQARGDTTSWTQRRAGGRALQRLPAFYAAVAAVAWAALPRACSRCAPFRPSNWDMQQTTKTFHPTYLIPLLDGVEG